MKLMKERLKSVPLQPGVYLYKDREGRVIYVGKAKILRNRMRSYFQSSHNLHPKVKAMMNRVADFDFIVTASEMEALLLENNLIKAYQPRYNIDLRDDKSYPYLKLTTGEAFPRLFVVREEKDGQSRYFGPYTEAGSLRETLRVLTSIFPLRTCRNLVMRDRPCLNRDIGKCLGPCTGRVDQIEYRKMVDELTSFMEGDYQELADHTEARMKEAAAELDFEKAARLRDQVQNIKKLGRKQKVFLEAPQNIDMLGLLIDGGATLAQVFKFRRGKLINKETYWLTRKMEESKEDLMEFLIKRYYEGNVDIPSIILLNHLPSNRNLLLTWLREEAGHKIDLKVPLKGEKRSLMNMLENTARLLMDEQVSAEARREKILLHLGQILELETVPERIECFDVSHLGGSETVASMVVFTKGLPDKKAYRRFKMKLEQNDDYRSLAEALERRFQEARQGNAHFLPEPDLLMIDGGLGQLHAAQKVLDGINAQIPVISLAKKREEVFTVNRREALVLPRRDEALQLLQRLRDEAHRFAISYNRQRRAQKVTLSLLDRIDGVGPKRKKALLQHFGSVNRIRQASGEEIASVPGISAKLAGEILQFLAEETKP